jgi:Baseplate J-like protein
MPIPLPDLDDRSYAELTAQARAMIPGLLPAWTDYNPSDPGTTLVELLAWLTEMLLFQVNQIPQASTEKFLKLINGPGWSPGQLSLDEEIRQAVLGLRERYRAVTAADYEYLTLSVWPATDEARDLPAVVRAQCVPQRDLSAPGPAAPAPAHMSLVVLTSPDAPPDPVARLLEALWRFFEERRTLTTRHHVVGPAFVPVTVSANLALRADAPPEKALTEARLALDYYFDPLTGGRDRAGWPFGRSAYASEASAVLQGLPLLRYVEDVELTAPGAAHRVQAGGAAVLLDAGELVRLAATHLVAYDISGQRYP